MLNWQDPHAYDFTRRLTAEQWAWEYLRRNPQYREEWEEFIQTWKALEACYGKPSQRDIAAWKRDPRAWVPAAECTESDCKIDDDKVLIECAMGARWGFYKFPPDPADGDPVSGSRLNWREFEIEPVWDDGREGKTSSHFASLRFDLSFPLQGQLASAKRLLQIEQRRRVKSGVLRPPRITAHAERLCRMLRLLDALEMQADTGQIRELLYPDRAEIDDKEKDEALRLRDHDYRHLLLLGPL